MVPGQQFIQKLEPVYNKWYGVINFNEDNKIATFSDWMDVNGMQVQIQQYLETSKN